MIVASELWKSFGNEEVLCGVSLEIAAGDTITLLGPNGVGKSTLISCLAGLLRPDSGTVELDGDSVYSALRSKELRGKMAGLGLMLQSSSLLYPALSIRENLQLYSNLYSDIRETRSVSELLEEFGLANAGGKTEQELSGGMLQRVKLARAFIACPDVLLLDEPTAYLDSSGVELILKIIKANEKAAKIITTHDSAFAAELGGRALHMSNGELRLEG